MPTSLSPGCAKNSRVLASRAGHHLGDLAEAAFGLAHAPPRRERVRHHRVAGRHVRESNQGARALSAVVEQAGLPERRRVPGHVGLGLAEQLRELAHRQLFFGGEGQQPQADGIAEQPVELPAGLAAGEGLHRGKIYAFMRMDATCE